MAFLGSFLGSIVGVAVGLVLFGVITQKLNKRK